MIIKREAVEEVVKQCWAHFDYDNAIAVSETYFNLCEGDEALHLLASSYLSSGRVETAYALLRAHGANSAPTRFVQARCCVALDKLAEAEELLTDDDGRPSASFGKSTAFALSLLADVYRKTDRVSLACQMLKECLKQNPFLWCAFQRFCDVENSISPELVEGIFASDVCAARSPYRVDVVESANATPSWEATAERTALGEKHNVGNRNEMDVGVTTTPSTEILQLAVPPRAPLKPHHARKAARPSQPSALTQRITRQSSKGLSFDADSAPRRSQRKLENRSSVKENVREKRLTALRPSDQHKLSERPALIIDADCAPEQLLKDADLSPRSRSQQAQSRAVLDSFKRLARVEVALSRYDTAEARRLLDELPFATRSLPYAHVLQGRAYFEASDYGNAVDAFAECRRAHRHLLDGVDVYSTALWHQQSECELSSLAQHLTADFRSQAETWVVAGNCFSLQKEHDVAIKFFERAIQLRADYAYAHTLLGHELIALDELDKAEQAFRVAVRLRPRHFNAWHGLGLVYHKRDKLNVALRHFERASQINPSNPVLMCYTGVVMHALGDGVGALQLMERALSLAPHNALCRYHRAQLLVAADRLDDALAENDQLKLLAPREPMVLFQAARLHKRLGQTHVALMNLSWATELDPRGDQSNALLGDRPHGGDDAPVLVTADAAVSRATD